MSEKEDIKNFTLDELKNAVSGTAEPAYRAKQIFSWLYEKGASDFSEMNNLSKALRDKFAKKYYISSLKLSERRKSADKTEKFLFKLSDGNFIETVLIYAKDRKTICLSTQVGCKFACSFCASGLMGFKRNLTPAEILNQTLFSEHNLKHKVTNYVFMGMGEPLDNYENVIKAIEIMKSKDGMDISPKRITVSTCGLVPGIEKLADSGLKINLSISLHAAADELRNSLMPINKKYPLKKLIETCKDFIDNTGENITLEYVLISGKNDSLNDAKKLAIIAKKLKAKVNLIPYSVVSNLDFQPSARKNTEIFMKRLTDRGINAILRQSKGSDINAACGQLAGKQKE